MGTRSLALVLALLGFCLLAEAGTLSKPVLLWKNAGCLDGIWCDRGWYSSPFVGDINKDGKVEIIASGYNIRRFFPNGTQQWNIPSGRALGSTADPVGRTWPGIIVYDIDKDGKNDLITGHEHGWVSVYEANGAFKKGWPKQLTTSGGEIRSLTVADIDNNNGPLEIIAGTFGQQFDIWVLSPNGTIRQGWPQKGPNTRGYATGIYNDNIGAFDVFPEEPGWEIVVPSDVHYVMVYNIKGQAMNASAFYKTPERWTWGEVGFYTDPATEKQGWGDCTSTSKTTRANFAKGTVVFSDLDKNAKPELVIVGNVYDCGKSDTDFLYYGPFVVNRDRTRWAPSAARNWTTVPVNTGAPLHPDGDFATIEDSQPNVVAADIDGDGIREIIYPSYNGKMKVFWVDKTTKYNWTNLNLGGEYPSEPVIIDVGNDGKAELIFTTWPTKTAGRYGNLWVVDYAGNVKFKVALPAPHPESGKNWNGCMAAPTIANIDANADYEIVLQTLNTGVVTYRLPGSAGARLIWRTGRGNFARNPNEWNMANKSCNDCKTACQQANSCGTNAACINNCKNQCTTSRKCY